MHNERTYRVLVIAPTSDLEFHAEEASAISNSLNAKSLQGQVYSRDIITEIQQQSWDIIWFVTHGTEDGVVVTDGLLGSGDLLPILRNSGAELVVFNTCSSLHVALDLRNELLSHIICTVTEVSDVLAYRTARHLAHRLSLGLSYKDAYEDSVPGGNSLYVFLQGRVEERQDASVEESDDQNEVDRLSDELGKVLMLIDGSTRWGVPGIIPELANIKKEIICMKQGLNQVRSRQTLSSIVQWLTFTVLIMLLILTAFLMIRIL